MNDLGKVTTTTNGNYDPDTKYERLSIVRYDGASWISKQSTQGNTPATGSAYWQLIAEDGVSVEIDATPTEGSVNLVTSNGIYVAISNAIGQALDTAY